MPQDEPQPPQWGVIVTRPQLGKALRRVREARDIAQVDLADAARVQRSTISAIENSHRSVNVETLMRLCDALDVEICLRDRQTPRPALTGAEMHRPHTGGRRRE